MLTTLPNWPKSLKFCHKGLLCLPVPPLSTIKALQASNNSFHSSIFSLSQPKAAMTSTTKEVAIELLRLIRVYKDRSVERLEGTPIVPPLPDQDPKTGVSSKDVTISEDPSISARLYLPELTSHNQNQKFLILVYFHGGGFCIESAFSSLYHCYLGNLFIVRKEICKYERKMSRV